MMYSIWTNPVSLVESVRKGVENRMFLGHGQKMRKARELWKHLCTRSEFFGEDGTEGVAREFYGPHEYEAKITFELQKELACKDFFKTKFAFASRQTVGQRVDIPRYLAGDQRCWFSTKRQKRTVPCVRVFAPMGGHGKVTAEQMEICGATTCAIVEMLESSGIGVELWMACCAGKVAKCFARPPSETDQQSETNPGHTCQMIKIKDCGEYCDIGMVNYLTGNSHFYRNIVLKDRFMLVMKYANQGRYPLTTGASYSFRKEHLPIEDEYNSDLDMFIPRIYDMYTAKMYIRSNFSEENSVVSKAYESALGKEREVC